MGKVRSAIVTTIIVLAIVALGFFSVISFSYSSGSKRYSSFVSSIDMSSEFTGSAYALMYPDGVISADEYDLVVNKSEDEEADSEKRDEYLEDYVQRGSVYVDRDVLGLDYDADPSAKGSKEDEFKQSVENDAKIMAKRYGRKGYSENSVAVEDDFVIRVTVPTDFTYAEYKGYDQTGRSTKISEISTTAAYFTQWGELSIRDSDTYEGSHNLILTEDVNYYFKSISYYSAGSSSAVRIKFTSDGYDDMNELLSNLAPEVDEDEEEEEDTEETYIYLYVGDQNTNISFQVGGSVQAKTVYYQTGDASASQDMAILLSSALDGEEIENEYNSNGVNSTTVVATTPTFGEYSAIWLGAIILVVLVAIIAAGFIRYKKLGWVVAEITLIYALLAILLFLLVDLEISLASILFTLLGLAILTFTNFHMFECARCETKAGRTFAAAVKTGYRKTVSQVLEMHIVLLICSILFAFMAKAVLATSMFVFAVVILGSYALYWFTRLIWFVQVSPAKDKFKFCGYSREVYEDEE